MSSQRATTLVQRRYDRLAPVYKAMDVLFLMPSLLRRKAVEQLGLVAGARVLEIACGTGKNLDLLVDAVGPNGKVDAIDISSAMLAKARKLIARRGWQNVTLSQQDASAAVIPPTPEAVLFCLSYTVIPGRREALRRAWDVLAPGGRLVIMDARLPDGLRGRILNPLALALSRVTVLGDPHVRVWEDLATLGEPVHATHYCFGTYVVATSTKPAV